MNRSFWRGLAAAVLLTGCAPTLDWRELRPEGSGLAVLMPCKPDSQARPVSLASTQVRMQLHACSAGGVTWGVAFADIGDPARVGAALEELRASAARNLGGAETAALPLQIPGATPNPASRRVQVSGRMPDGRAVVEQTAVFAKGTRVFQAVALGTKLEPEAVATFFGGLRLLP
ncbi:MAG: hypothetical protein KF720_20470 [Rubrivivax sp.]|nr:hypothetical protein [Rubrivivax sp.]